MGIILHFLKKTGVQQAFMPLMPNLAALGKKNARFLIGQ
jgi:hypothetical protein